MSFISCDPLIGTFKKKKIFKRPRFWFSNDIMSQGKKEEETQTISMFDEDISLTQFLIFK